MSSPSSPRREDPPEPAPGATFDRGVTGVAPPSGPISPKAIDPELAGRIRAYPGTLTFHDLIRRNKRQSAVLMMVMIGLGVLLGVVFGAALGAAGGYHQRAGMVRGLPDAVPGIEALTLPMVAGGVVALLLASLGAAWSWFGGASAILMMSRAREIQKQDDPQLFNVVDEVRLAAGLPMPRVYLIDDTAMNAFATGRDPAHGVVAITTGLRERLNRDELQGVLAHEMAHIRHLDIRFALLMATMVGLIAFACDGLFRVFWHGGDAMGRGSRDSKGKGGGVAVVLILMAMVLAVVAPILARIIQMAYSREREYLADAGAVELTRNPAALASALMKLADDDEPLVDGANRGTAHLFIVNPLRKMREAHQGLNSVFWSHPPVRERIARLMALTR